MSLLGHHTVLTFKGFMIRFLLSLILVRVVHNYVVHIVRASARMLIGGGGGVFIYSGSARLVSFVIKLISKEISRA